MNRDRACTRTALELPWLLNDTLVPADRRRVREHLIHCPACREELASTRSVLESFGAGPAQARPSDSAPNRPVAHQRALRRVSWAAAAALVLSLVGGLWALRERDGQTERRMQGSAPALAAESSSQEIFVDGFESGSLSGWRQRL